MASLSPGSPAVSSPLAAGLLLASLPLLATLDLPHPTAVAVIEAVGVSRSRAYEVKATVEAAVADLPRPPGRPPAPPAPPTADRTVALSRTVLDYVMNHPGCVHGSAERRRYGDGFRAFILVAWEQHPGLDLAAFSEAVRVPVGTLKDWVKGGRDAITNLEPVNLVAQPAEAAKGPRIESILAAYAEWKGSFVTFCDHVQLHLHIPWGRTLIAEVLEASGVRLRDRRRGRRPDEKALRDSFETFFPSAQWSADGSPLTVTLDGQTYTFNLELDIDTHTGALVGMSLRDTEDGAAVVDAWRDGVIETGAQPLAQLLDNRPSNHTDDVTDALGTTMKIRRTQGRPQNGAHVEGAFGLFQQTVPPIVLDRRDGRELARTVLGLVTQTWARTLNHRPSADQDGRSRVRRYLEATPSPDEIHAARAALRERLRKQELARQTRQARLDPVTRAMLASTLQRWGLLDPDGHIQDAIAGYPLDAVLAGMATFEAKRNRATLPEGVDARYLLGIVRRIADEDEGLAFAESLWQARRDAGDVVLAGLDEQRQRDEEADLDPLDLVRRFTDLAMGTDRAMDRSFWLHAIVEVITEQPDEEHRNLFLLAARRIHTVHRVPKKLRNATVRRLAALALPIT